MIWCHLCGENTFSGQGHVDDLGCIIMLRVPKVRLTYFCSRRTMLTHVGAEESSKSAMYVLAPLLSPLITCRGVTHITGNGRGDNKNKVKHGLGVKRRCIRKREDLIFLGLAPCFRIKRSL